MHEGYIMHACIIKFTQDAKPDVCQSAFALVGDLAKCCMAHLKPVLNGYMPLLVQNLNPYFIAVCNNASWAVSKNFQLIFHYFYP